jgi:nucleoside-diphosphate-sugar epimerase
LEAHKLVSRCVKSSDRVLILGYSGWFGSSASELLVRTGAQILGSNSKGLKMISDGPKHVFASTFQGCKEFEPTIVIDSAFLTREKIQVLGTEAYISINKTLMQQGLEISELDSVERFIGISSGAAIGSLNLTAPHLLVDPYGALKSEYEYLLMNSDLHVRERSVLLRAWSMSGPHVRNPELFALFDLIKQSKSRIMRIRSNAHVYRRYSDVEDLLAVGLASTTGGTTVDSGGELVEIGELAKIIREVLGSTAVIHREVTSSEDDHYYSDGDSWQQEASRVGLSPKTLREQIAYSAKRF